MQYGTVDEQLALIGRCAVPIKPDGNCMFASVACQLSRTAEKDLEDPMVLRLMAVEQGMEFFDNYKDFNVGDVEQFVWELIMMKKDGAWNYDIGDLAIHLLRDALKMKFVILQTRLKPVHIPDDGKEIDDNTVVLIRDQIGKHYDGTNLLMKRSDEGEGKLC